MLGAGPLEVGNGHLATVVECRELLVPRGGR